MISGTTLSLFIQAFMAALTAAPQVIALAEKFKKFIGDLFAAGLITKEQQDLVWNHVDSLVAMIQAGIVPPHWTVEPNPVG